MPRNPPFQNEVDRIVNAHFEQTAFSAETVSAGNPTSVTGPVFIRLSSKRAAVLPGRLKEHDPPNATDPVGEFDIGQTAVHVVDTGRGEVHTEGCTLVCLCPDCDAPMSVRIWLELADCWRCRTSIRLSAEQLKAARQMSATMPASIQPAADAPPATLPVPLPAPVPVPTAAAPAIPTTSPPDYRELDQLTQGSLLATLVRRGFRLTPAWVFSFLIHLVLLLVLALIIFGGSEKESESITLSTSHSRDREIGGDIRLENPLDMLQDDLLPPNDLPEREREIRDVIQRAESDARQLRVDPQPVAPQQSFDVLRRNVTTNRGQMMAFDARDPRVRSEIVRREGGTLLTEAAVARGLRWLASVQNQDGSWSLGDWQDHNRPRNKGDALATSLALLPFLGAGQTHEFGIYKDNVARGLAWMVNHQTDDGDLRAGYKDNAGMYAHGQGAIVLCEVLAMTGDEQFREPAQLAIRFIEQVQHPQGGWRYRPGQAGDTSVFGWQVMALQSARAANTGIAVADSTFSLADYFLDRVSVDLQRRRRSGNDDFRPVGALYAYLPGRAATSAITAEALLCRMYLGWKNDDPRLRSGIDWLMKNHFPSREDTNVYYWYYGSQLMHHYGGEVWETWNRRVKQLLLSSQETRGRYPGSWNPGEFEWGSRGGRIYTTALSVCTLEVYYRHLPLFRPLELDGR